MRADATVALTIVSESAKVAVLVTGEFEKTVANGMDAVAGYARIGGRRFRWSGVCVVVGDWDCSGAFEGISMC